VVNDLETQREGASYTVDTLDELQLRHPSAHFYVLVGADQAASFTVDTLEALQLRHPNADFCVLVGADQAASFTQWHQWQRILEMAQLVVVQRHDTIADQAYPHEWHNLPSERVTRMHMPLMDISSSALRASYASGHPNPELVSPLVAHYIQQNQLYLEPHDRSR